MDRLPVMSGRGVSLIVLAVFLPTFKFASVVIQTAQILTPKNVLTAKPQYLPNGKMTSAREAVSRIARRIFGLTPAHRRGSIDTSPIMKSATGRDGKRRLSSHPEDR